MYRCRERQVHGQFDAEPRPRRPRRLIQGAVVGARVEDVVDVRVQPLGVDGHRGCGAGVDVAGHLHAVLVVFDFDFCLGLAAGVDGPHLEGEVGFVAVGVGDGVTQLDLSGVHAPGAQPLVDLFPGRSGGRLLARHRAGSGPDFFLGSCGKPCGRCGVGGRVRIEGIGGCGGRYAGSQEQHGGGAAG